MALMGASREELRLARLVMASDNSTARNRNVQLEDTVVPKAQNNPDNQLIVLQFGGLGALVLWRPCEPKAMV